MKWSEIYLKTLKEKPAGASINSHVLLLRSGSVFMSSQGIYTYNSLFLRSIHKLSQIIKEELEKQSAREILMPMVQNKELWTKSNRWDQFEGLLLKMKSRTGAELCLGPTHEELIIDFVQKGLNSWRDMPINLYQIQTKYRDEIRPRFGLMRAREFLMKDAYSFDENQEMALTAYKKMFKAYQNIFNRLGVKYVVVKADSGAIGGSHSEEFHILADKGEDEILVAEDFSANVEVCPRKEPKKPQSGEKQQHSESQLESQQAESQDEQQQAESQDEHQQAESQTTNPQNTQQTTEPNSELKKIEELATPNIKSIPQLAQFLKVKNKDLVKILFFISNEEAGEQTNNQALKDLKSKAFAILCLGDDEVNPLKVKQELKLKQLPLLANKQNIKTLTGVSPGSCGPYNLKIPIPIYLDNFLKTKNNFITGANKEGFHLKNINPVRDFKVKAYGDFCFAREKDLSPKGFSFKKYRGIEVGHLFYLSDEYSKKMNLTYIDKQGKKQFVKMGCYGLGVTRSLQAIVEQNHDPQGIIWPLAVAPFAVHICLIDPKNPEVLAGQKQLIEILNQLGLDYFIDDRLERPGVKFKDADLIGLPLRVNLGSRDLKNNHIELCIRKNNQRFKLSLKELKNKLPKLLKDL